MHRFAGWANGSLFGVAVIGQTEDHCGTAVSAVFRGGAMHSFSVARYPGYFVLTVLERVIECYKLYSYSRPDNVGYRPKK